MSHSFVVVLVPEGTEDVESAVEKALEPFNEATQVESYQKGCHCVGWTAQVESRKAAGATAAEAASVADFNALRDAYWNTPESERPEWEEHIAAYQAVYEPLFKQLHEAHPLYEKLDPSCEECSGTGTYETTYNPKSKWDWYRIGGRWDGEITGIERESADGGFNFADNHEQLQYNSAPVSELKENFTCFAVLTPNGEWHEKGHMGWFGMVIEEKDNWYDQMRMILAANNDALAVGCDLHI